MARNFPCPRSLTPPPSRSSARFPSLYRKPCTPPYLFLLPVAARCPRTSALANRYLHVARAAAMTICEYRLPTYHDARVLLVAVTACSYTRLRSHDTSPDTDTACRNLASFRIRCPSLGLTLHLAALEPRLASPSPRSLRSAPHTTRSRSSLRPRSQRAFRPSHRRCAASRPVDICIPQHSSSGFIKVPRRIC